MSDDGQYSRKRRRLQNQIQGGFTTPPDKVNGVNIKSCNLVAECPGTWGMRNVNINVVNNKYKFRCDCAKYDEDEIESCCHINAVFIKMLNDYIDNSVMFEEKKEKFLNLKQDLKSLMDEFDKIEITNKEENKENTEMESID